MLAIYYHPIMLFIFGACWGSFFNVVFYRYPLGKSVVQPGSACPSCNHAIAIHDNIPILSWLILRGKCRQCKATFSSRYMWVEAFFGVLATIPYWIHPNHWLAGIWLSALFLTLCPTIYLLLRHRKAPWYLWVTSLVTISGYAINLASI